MQGQGSSSSDKRRSVSSPKKKKRKYSQQFETTANASTKSNPHLTSLFNTPSSSSASSSPNAKNLNLNNKTCVNIIDRTMDLTKYTNETSLYSLCRDWMFSINQNDQVNNKQSQASFDETTSEEESNHLTSNNTSKNSYFINKLPDPIKRENEGDMMTIEELNKNIADEIRSTEKEDMEIVASLNVDEVIQSHALLNLHVNRWKLAKNEWLNYYNYTNKTYKNSYETLKSIFEDM